MKNHLLLSAITVGLLAFAGCKAKTDKNPVSDMSSVVETKAALERIQDSIKTAQSTTGQGHPVMWKMADEDTTIYLFGTVHLLPKDLEWQTQSFTDAFNSADTLYLETDSTSEVAQLKMQELIMAKAMMPEGESLSTVLTADQQEIVKGAAEKIGLPYAGLQNLRPWFSGLQMGIVQIMREGYDPQSGVEQVLTKAAQEQGKTLGQFETLEEQISFLTGGTMEQQVENLLFTAQTIDTGSDMLNALVDEWKDGDVKGLAAMMGEPSMFGTVDSYNTLIVKRNKNWLPKIEAILDDPGTKFVAVGAGHLSGPDSVIKMLKTNGHTVELVQ